MPAPAVDHHPSPSGFRVSARAFGDTALVTCHGRLGRGAVGGCALVLAHAVVAGARHVVAEMDACPATNDTLALLALMRRYANRHGLDFTVVVPDPDERQALSRALGGHVATMYGLSAGDARRAVDEVTAGTAPRS